MSENMKRIWETINAVVPGGIDANAKYFDNMPVIRNASGCYLVDIDGNQYIDYGGGYGPLIFGHKDPDIVAAIKGRLETGWLFGLPHESMRDAAMLVGKHYPAAEMVRFTNSGTEATLSTIRLARAVTGKSKIVKFYGGYHGTHEWVLIGTAQVEKAPVFPRVQPNTAGIPESVQNDTLVLPFNDIDFTVDFIKKNADQIAVVLLEPMMGGSGIVADREFVEALRKVTGELDILLVFDEIITGFRLALGGAAELFGIQPDLVTLGKAMGGGFPVAAFGGRRKYMERISPAWGIEHDPREVVYHSGTYNSNALLTACVCAAIEKLEREPVYEKINSYAQNVRDHFHKMMKRYGIRGALAGTGSVLFWYFGIEGPIKNLSDIEGADHTLQKRFHALLLQNGLFFTPYIRGYVSYAHGDTELCRTMEGIEAAFKQL